MSTLKKCLFALGVAALASAATMVLLNVYGQSGRPLQKATALPEPLPLPEFFLIDQAGEPFDRTRFLGRYSLVFFGFTHCPDICPATLQQLAITRDRLIAEDQASPDIVLISVDPERDTPALLAEYTAHFGAGVYGATGTTEELRKLTGALGIYFEKSPSGDGSYSVAHSAVVLLIDPSAEFRAVFSAPHDIDAMVSDLPVLMSSG